MSKITLNLVIALLINVAAFSQVTTGTITGIVVNAEGKGLSGATVEAVHEPSGSRYRTSTTSDGRFNLPALRVGGPYSITVSYVGFEKQEVKDIIVQLGEPTKADVLLMEANKQLKEVVITGSLKNTLISKDKKGTSTNINRRLLASAPTLNRSITDFTRLTPQANGTSFGGQDNRFINLTIDGSIFNNSFGLQALPGSQTNSTPISLDAIEEIQVNISPYNLKDAGFTGASINAVTRSGTNTFHGSGFYNTRNESYTGDKAGLNGDQAVVTSSFDVKQFGGSIGGPIIKNKLFFFANYEGERRTDPGTSFTADKGQGTGGNVTRVKATDLDNLSKFMSENFGYQTGPYENYSLVTQSDKALLKFDWNINDKHKLSLRGNVLKSKRDVPISGSGGFGNRNGNLLSMTYANSNYEINNDIYSGIAQLNSRFSNKFSNELIFGYTANRDYRKEKSISFPTIDILDGNSVNYISLGSEPFTPNNLLDTDTWQFSDNATLYLGKHTVSMGFNFESFTFFNQFTPTVNGQYIFRTLNEFYSSANAYLANPNQTTNQDTLRRYNLTYSNMPGGVLWNAETKARNIGFYVQDDITLDEKLSITYGVRFDIPYFAGSGFINTEVDGFNFIDEEGNTIKLSTSELPKGKLMISPRFGFNYDVFGNKKTQIRGGIGLFTGRPAFVWISNQIGNNGVQSGSISVDNTKAYPFSPDVTRNIPVIANPGTPAPSYNIATTENAFRFPQVLRANLGFDQNIGLGIIASAEMIFTQSLSNVLYYNANLKPTTLSFAGPDNRPRFNTFGSNGRLLTGSAFNNASRINPKINDATVLKSGPYGGSFMATIKLEKPVRSKGLGWMIAYNYGSTRDFMSAGSIAASSWRDMRSVRGNNSVDISYSDNDIRNRFIGNINYRIELAKTVGLQFSLAGQSQNQGRVTYTFSGDMNGDGLQGNDLIYIPRDKSEMNFEAYTVTGGPTFTVQQQQDAFEKFINQDSYLRENRGKYADRNGLLLPMVTRFDLSTMLELFHNIGRQRHTIQLRADIFNIGNLINSKWGVGYTVNTFNPLAANGYNTTTNAPIYRMNAVNNTLNYTSTRRGTGLIDVWQAQFGIRYIF